MGECGYSVWYMVCSGKEHSSSSSLSLSCRGTRMPAVCRRAPAVSPPALRASPLIRYGMPVPPHCRPPPASSASPSLPNLVPAHRPTLPGLGHPVDVPIPPVASALCQTCLPRCSRKLPAMLPALPVPLPTAVRLCNSDSAAYYARHDHYSAYPPPQTHTFNIALSSPQPSPPRIVTQIQPHRRRTPPDQGRGVLV